MTNFLFASFKRLTNFEHAYWNHPQNSILCDWSMFSSVDLSMASGKMCKNWLVYWITDGCGFLYALSLSKSPFWVFEAGYWKDFQNQ